MSCPICAELQREHGRECEVEAKAILRQRAAWLPAPGRLAPTPDASIDDVALESRKRQALLISKLHIHRETNHAKPEKATVVTIA